MTVTLILTPAGCYEVIGHWKYGVQAAFGYLRGDDWSDEELVDPIGRYFDNLVLVQGNRVKVFIAHSAVDFSIEEVREANMDELLDRVGLFAGTPDSQ